MPSNDELLAWSTVGLAGATGALVVVGVVAAVVGLRELRTAKQIAAADARRRRAEATISAVLRFMVEHDREYPKMLSAARAVTAKRKAEAQSGEEVERCSVQELLSQANPPEDAIASLRRCLDALEEIAIGARLGVYDSNIVYHIAKTKLTFLYMQGRAHVERVRGGVARSHISQSSAWEHSEWLVTKQFRAIESAGAPRQLVGALDDA